MKVLILGLGQFPQGSGIAAALYFAKQGHEVRVTDLKTGKELAANVKTLKKLKNVSFTLGRHDPKDVRWADLIVRNPRVRKDLPEMKLAAKLDKPMESDLSIFFKSCPCPIIGITGTRGKSTVTMMTYEILRASNEWRKVWLGGNILVSPLTFLHQVTVKDIVVLEMSSFQLEATGEAGVSPHLAVWTNLFRDHLNAYPSMAEYAEAKAQIFRHQQPDDVLFLPATSDFDSYAKEAPGSVIRVKPGKYALAVPGEHNRMNASFAAAVASELGLKKAIIEKSLKNFKGLPFRQQMIGVKKGITIINDSTSTMPDATIAALASIRGRVHLLFGGNDKELKFEDVAKTIKKTKPVVYLMPGNADKKILKAFKKEGIACTSYKSWKDAVAAAHKAATKGETILFSPGCTSFGEFKNEFDRGETFNELIKKWK